MWTAIEHAFWWCFLFLSKWWKYVFIRYIVILLIISRDVSFFELNHRLLSLDSCSTFFFMLFAMSANFWLMNQRLIILWIVLRWKLTAIHITFWCIQVEFNLIIYSPLAWNVSVLLLLCWLGLDVQHWRWHRLLLLLIIGWAKVVSTVASFVIISLWAKGNWLLSTKLIWQN